MATRVGAAFDYATLYARSEPTEVTNEMDVIKGLYCALRTSL